MAKVFNRILGGGGGGGASANIYVTGLSQTDTCTMTTPSGKVVNGEWGEITLVGAIENPAMTSATTPSGTVSCKDYYSTYYPYHAFDNDDSTELISSNSTKGGSSWYVQYQFPSEILINSVYLVGATNIQQTYDVQVLKNGAWFKVADASVVNKTPVTIEFEPVLSTTVRLSGKTSKIIGTSTNYNYQLSTIKVYGIGETTVNAYTFQPNEYGTHTITASNGTKTSTEQVLVDALMDYYVGMDFKLWLYKYGDERKGVTGGWNN